MNLWWTTTQYTTVEWEVVVGGRDRCLRDSDLPSECLLWSGVRTAGRTAVPVQCQCGGQTLSSTPGTPMNAMTGNMSGCSVCCYCHKVFSIVYIVNCHAALCISRVTVVPLIFRVNLLKLFLVADLEGGWGVTTPLLPRI